MANTSAPLRLIGGKDKSGKFIGIARQGDKIHLGVLTHSGQFLPSKEPIHLTKMETITNVFHNFDLFYNNLKEGEVL